MRDNQCAVPSYWVFLAIPHHFAIFTPRYDGFWVTYGDDEEDKKYIKIKNKNKQAASS